MPPYRKEAQAAFQTLASLSVGGGLFHQSPPAATASVTAGTKGEVVPSHLSHHVGSLREGN